MKLESLKEKIESQNAEFDAMTNAEKRVAVAQDCLDRIEIGQIHPDGGLFFSKQVFNASFNENEEIVCSWNLKDVLNSEIPTCSACAKGGLFLSYVGRVNNYSIGDISDGNDELNNNHKKLLEIFDIEQLSAIEFAFEGRQHIHNDLNGNKIYHKKYDELYSFSDKFTTYKDLMIDICKNIIENKGTFVW